jgi:hypothetical protein
MSRQELFTKPRPYDTKFRRNIAKFRGISRNFAKVFSYFAKFREISRYEISSTTLIERGFFWYPSWPYSMKKIFRPWPKIWRGYQDRFLDKEKWDKITKRNEILLLTKQNETKRNEISLLILFRETSKISRNNFVVSLCFVFRETKKGMRNGNPRSWLEYWKKLGSPQHNKSYF